MLGIKKGEKLGIKKGEKLGYSKAISDVFNILKNDSDIDFEQAAKFKALLMNNLQISQ